MSYRKLPRITNLWSKVIDGDKGQWLSKVVIEATKPFDYTARNINGSVVLEGTDVILNMPAGTVVVNDGLLREVNINFEGKESALAEMVLEYPVEFRINVLEGFPFRLEVAIDRSCLKSIFGGKKIVIDPGHGGTDDGGRGPVSLLEKNVVLPIAENLEKLLLLAGAEVFLTRSTDQNVPKEKRFGLAGQVGAGLYIGIHTHVGADGNIDGAATLYAPSSGKSAALARYVQDGLVKKLKVKDRGTVEKPELTAIDGLPAIEVEVMTITNLVEEVCLRGLTVRKKAAEGIFNGLIQYFAPNGQNPKGDIS